MPGARIDGKEYPIGKMFSDEFAFEIPPYQRPYAWTKDHAAELLDDLVGAMGDGNCPVEELDPYFLGSIVLVKEEGSPDAQVVDGQQRLATLAMFLAALRATLRGQEAEGVTALLYERGNEIMGTPNRYRLKLRPRDADFFRDYVQEAGGVQKLTALDPNTLSTDSQRSIRENALVFLDWLQNMEEAQRGRLAKFVARRCYLVAVSTRDLDSAYRIFWVLNARGLDLSHADILKAEIIGKIKPDVREAYTDKWEEAEVRLGRDPFAELFSHVRMIYRRAKLRATVLKEFREYVLSTATPEEVVDKVLLPFADAYYDVRNASYESGAGPDHLNEALRWLNRIDNTDWVPPAMLFLCRNMQHPAKLGAFLQDLERLAAGLMIRRATINERIERYGRLLRAIEDEQNLDATDSPLQLTPGECKEIIEKLGGDLYLVPAIPQYVLLRLDSTLAGSGATYQYPLITVEHVLPQNPAPGTGWLVQFPWGQNEEWVHRLANLVLLARKKNSAARNYDFARKKQVYFTTPGVPPFALTTQVANEQEWTPAVLERRQETLMAELKKLWRLTQG